jgi:hypothetical protein
MVQKVVNVLPAIGVAGQKVATDSARYLGYNPLSDGTVVVGAFAFAKTAGGVQSAPFAIVSGTGSADAVPLGFVERVMDVALENVTSSGTNILPEGAVATVAVQGQFYINVPVGLSSITSGMGVYVNPTTGAINLASSAGTGEVDTGFKVVIPNGGASANAGDVVIIEKFN